MRKLSQAISGFILLAGLSASAAVWAVDNLNQPDLMSANYFNQDIPKPVPPANIFTPDSSSLRPNYNPGPITQGADLVLNRPALFVSTALGTGAFIITLPFTYLNGSADEAHQKLMVEPFQAATSSCLGCSSTLNLND